MYADHKDHKSTLGYTFLATGGMITWKSNKQSIMAQLSTEAEYIALWEAGKEASWLRNLYNEIGHAQGKATLISCDNNGAVAIARNPMFHKRTKHIDSKYHWIWEKVEEECFYPVSCRTAEQTTDVLTKALPCPKYEQHRAKLGIALV